MAYGESKSISLPDRWPRKVKSRPQYA